MKYVWYSLSILIFVSSIITAQTITSFLSHSKPIKLTVFMDLLDLQGDERSEFQAYYHDTIEALRTMRTVRKNVRLQKLEQQGINSLEIKQPQWARELSTLLKKDHPLYSNAHTFVVRYASLELYYEQKAKERNNTWAKMRGFFSQTKETVAGWFSSLRPKKKVV